MCFALYIYTFALPDVRVYGYHSLADCQAAGVARVRELTYSKHLPWGAIYFKCEPRKCS